MIFRDNATQRAKRRAQDLGINLSDWFGSCRDRGVSWPRQAFWVELRSTTDMSLPQIGRLFNRDHTTVLHGIQEAEKRSASQ